MLELCNRFCLNKAIYDKNVVDVNLGILVFSSQHSYLCPKMSLHSQYLCKKSDYHLFLRLHIQCHMLHDTFLNSIFASLLLKIILSLDGCVHAWDDKWMVDFPYTPFFLEFCGFHSAFKLAPIFNHLTSLSSFLFPLPSISQF